MQTMKHDISDFIHAVSHSKLLTREQKRELSEHPELLPELYRMELTIVLHTYDARARMREDEVGKRMEEATNRFAKDLDAHDIPDDIKKDLLEKSHKYIASLARQAVTS